MIVALEQIVDLECGLTEELVRALALESEQLALDRADRRARDVAIFGHQFAGVLGAGYQRLLQIIEIEQQQAVVVSIFEGDRQDAFLGVVEAEQSRQQQRPHFGNRRADRVPFFAVKIPEHRRIVAVGIVGDAQILGALLDRVGVRIVIAAGHADARQIAFDVGEEHRDAVRAELFRDRLEGHGLARAGRPRDQPVAIGPRQREELLFAIGGQAEVDVIHALQTPGIGAPMA